MSSHRSPLGCWAQYNFGAHRLDVAESARQYTWWQKFCHEHFGGKELLLWFGVQKCCFYIPLLLLIDFICLLVK